MREETLAIVCGCEKRWKQESYRKVRSNV